MSGGHYAYSYYAAEGLARSIDSDLSNPDYEITIGGEAIRSRLAMLRDLSFLVAELGREADLFMSCDTGDDTFIREFDEALDLSLLRVYRAELGSKSEHAAMDIDVFLEKVRKGEITGGHGFWGFPGGTYTESMIQVGKHMTVPQQATYVEWYP